MKAVILISILCLITCRAQVSVSESNDVASQVSDSTTPNKPVVTSATDELSTVSSLTEPSTDAPPAEITSPSSAPAKPSMAPAPTKPTPAPIKPTPAPIKPTPAPTEPTPAPTEPTPAPTKPTPAPTEPTSAATTTTPTASPINTTVTESTTTAIPGNGQSWSWRSFFSGVILMIVIALFGAGGFYLYLYKRRVSPGLGYQSL